MTTLISFLGKGKEGRGYNTACYRFDDVPRTVPFFGMALADYLRPDRLILVGTAGSMWDVFFEHETITEDEDLLALMEAVVNNTVDRHLLKNFSGRLSQKIGIPVECLLIDYARDEKGQIDLLTRLAEKLSENESIALDVTHSFRHLPMLALVAARFLTIVRKVVVKDIFYGALEMTENGETPVIRLKGLLDMLDWVDALASFDKNGDYRVFASLYKNAGDGTLGISLERASFFERINQSGNARKALREIPEQMPGTVSPMIRLFHPELAKRMGWARNEKHTDRQEAMARQHLQNGDYLRAATLGFESAISRELQTTPRHDPLDHEQRDEAKKRLDAYVNAPGKKRTPVQQAYLDLRELRNALAHGTRSQFAAIQNAMSSDSTLQEFLAERLRLVAELDSHQ